MLLSIAPAQAQETAPPDLKSQEWRVATRNIPPFVVSTGEAVSGFSVDLWNGIAREIGVRSTFAVAASLPLMLEAVTEHRADLAIAAISITADREQRFDFSVPMFDGGLQIAVPADSQNGALATLRQLFGSAEIYEFIGVLLLLALIPTTLVWLFERRHDDGIISHKGRARGFPKALWWSVSTLGAQAEEMPRSPGGRIVAVVWMFATLLLTTSFIAIVTTSMTVDRLKSDIAGPQDLPGKRIATVAGSTSARYLRERNVEVEEFPNVQDAYRAVEMRRVHGIVYDSPVLQYYVAHEGSGTLRLVGPIFRKQSYGILFPPNDPRRKLVNAALLRMRENGGYETIYQKWFGTAAAESNGASR